MVIRWLGKLLAPERLRTEEQHVKLRNESANSTAPDYAVRGPVQEHRKQVQDAPRRNTMVDQIDILARLTPGSELYRIRRERPEFVEGAELCREAVLSPASDFGISPATRAALAARMARLIGFEELAKGYDARWASTGSSELLQVIASGGDLPTGTNLFIAALVRHADLVTAVPRDSTRSDIQRLEAAGLSNPQIVALTELIAFVNFEARVIVGLSVLESVV